MLTHVFVNDNTCNSGGLHVSRPPNARDYIFLGRNFIYLFSVVHAIDGDEDDDDGNVHESETSSTTRMHILHAYIC